MERVSDSAGTAGGTISLMRGIHPPQLCKQLRHDCGIFLKVNTLALTGLVWGLLTPYRSQTTLEEF